MEDKKRQIEEKLSKHKGSVPMIIQGRTFVGGKFTIEDLILHMLEEALKRETNNICNR